MRFVTSVFYLAGALAAALIPACALFLMLVAPPVVIARLVRPLVPEGAAHWAALFILLIWIMAFGLMLLRTKSGKRL